MIILSSTNDIVNVDVAGGTGYAMHYVSTYIDRDQTTGEVGAADRRLTTAVSASTTTLVQAPASGTTRKVSSLFLRNAHASSAATVVVYLYNGSTEYQLYQATLLAGESLNYMDGVGFKVVSDTTRSERIMMLYGTSTHATAATWANIGTLTCPMKAGVLYSIFAVLFHANDASTTGSRFGFNIDDAPSSSFFSLIDVVTPSVTSATMCSGSTSARDTALAATTTGSTATRLAIISGMLVPSAAGTFALRASSEVTVANGLRIWAGSFLRVFRATG